MNIYDVSEKAGVSIATVSRVLNLNPNVSEKTRDKVIAVMDELGYTPNIFARGLGLNSMQTIGILCSDPSDLYIANAIYYLEKELRANKYDSILCCTGYEKKSYKKYIDLLLSKRVDAIILTGSKYINLSGNNDYLINASKEVPIILINGYLQADNIYSHCFDDYKATFDAVKFLKEKGKKRILYMYTSLSQSGLEKMRGYEDACKKFGIKYDDKYIVQCPKQINAAKEKLKELKNKNLKFDSIIASSDYLAVGALKYAAEMKISIPDELSIIGYDNSILSTATIPEISSIDSKVERLCTSAVKNLMKVLSGKKINNNIKVKVNIILRETT